VAVALARTLLTVTKLGSTSIVIRMMEKRQGGREYWGTNALDSTAAQTRFNLCLKQVGEAIDMIYTGPATSAARMSA